jgi:hypothetical protein
VDGEEWGEVFTWAFVNMVKGIEILEFELRCETSQYKLDLSGHIWMLHRKLVPRNGCGCDLAGSKLTPPFWCGVNA